MSLAKLMVMEANEGILLVNPQNAEMLAIASSDVQAALRDLKIETVNESVRKLMEPLRQEEIWKPDAEPINGIGIVPTYNCNCACTYCFEKEFEKSEMTSAMVRNIRLFVERWKKERNCLISINEVAMMGGEILRTDSRELMCTILEEFGNIDYKFTTNGIDLLDYKDIILKYRPTVTVSLDGTEHMQAKRRKTNVQNSYNKIIEGIRFLVEAGIKTAIATVYTPKFSAKEYKEFFDLLESLGWLHKENVSVTMTMEMDPGIQGCARDKQLEIINGYIALMLEDKRAQKTVRNILLGVGNLEKTLKDKREDGKIDLIRCPANISSGLVFAPDGYVYNCNFIKEKENRVGRFYPSIEVYDGVVKAFEQRNVYTMEECKQCDMALFCKGGCPASAITKYGELQRGFCGVWKDEELLRHVDLVINVEGLFHVARKYTRGNDCV